MATLINMARTRRSSHELDEVELLSKCSVYFLSTLLKSVQDHFASVNLK